MIVTMSVHGLREIGVDRKNEGGVTMMTMTVVIVIGVGIVIETMRNMIQVLPDAVTEIMTGTVIEVIDDIGIEDDLPMVECEMDYYIRRNESILILAHSRFIRSSLRLRKPAIPPTEATLVVWNWERLLLCLSPDESYLECEFAAPKEGLRYIALPRRPSRTSGLLTFVIPFSMAMWS
jgi:hypothetical protein